MWLYYRDKENKYPIKNVYFCLSLILIFVINVMFSKIWDWSVTD